MAATVASTTRGTTSFPVYEGGGHALCVAHGTYEFLTNPEANSIITYCRVPKGAVIVGGWWGGDDLDTGTEALDIDIGWPANGVDSANTAGLGNLGVLTGDVSVHLGAAGIWIPLQGTLLSTGPLGFGAETSLQALVNVTANATGTGTSSLVAYYYVA